MNSDKRRIGRFDIVRLLGTGAQSAVYLGYDPHLEREVAIKTLHFAGKDPTQNRFLLNEARTVSKLRHPHVVPIFEAGEEEGDPYLVFEYVEGRTLAEMIVSSGPMPPPQAAALLVPVLDAIDCAHRAGTIHRDLKPSNILLDQEGVPKVMDFGIATRLSLPAESNDALMGTPAYLSPEYVNDRVVSPQLDVYAAGLVLYEMVFGRRAVQADRIDEALHRVSTQEITYPAEPVLPDGLRTILAKALARDPRMRYGSAGEMKEALEAYLHPPLAEAPQDGSRPAGHSTLEFLLRRMRHKSDFPALSAAISTINRLVMSETENVMTLASSILKDFALTNKILRVVNSPYYRTASGGNISTISRAIVVLGFSPIRSIAISLVLFEHLQDKAHAAQLKEEFIRANLCGILARGLAPKSAPREAEEAFIGALFHNLGRLLTQYYFPEEAEAIQHLMASENCGEETAAARILGMGYQDLGIGIAQTWGFPDSLIYTMRRLPPGRVLPPTGREDRLRLVASLSNAICAAVQQHPPEHHARELTKIRQRYGDAVALTEREIETALSRSLDEIAGFSRIIGVSLSQTRIGRQLLATAGPTPEAPATAPEGTLADATLLFDQETDAAKPAPPSGTNPPEETAESTPVEPAPLVDAQTLLTAGIQDISNSLADEFALNDLLQIILETMYRAMNFEHVLMCLRDARTQTMNARFGLGEEVDKLVRLFRFRIGPPADVFNLVLSKGVDLLVSDAAEPKIAGRIPEWYRATKARTFMLFPLAIKNKPVGLIYADRGQAGSIIVSERELALLRTLRNQAVLAIKQSSA